MISHLQHFGLKPNGTVQPVLREILKRHLKSIADSVEHVDHVQVNPPLGNASAVCAVGKDILLCADDGTRDVLQVTREYDGVTTHGNVTKISFYSEYNSNVESITVIGQFAYFSASSSYAEHGGLLRCSLETGEVLSVLINSENPPSEV